ncbi:Alpha/Beta hydrolase protein [Limtongia smithiae]|uniref:Alpha/Beta hydrolase protein n=1 Tax=Limtongia smithiae TaxID=1125753 RepID=UPI0034CE406D
MSGLATALALSLCAGGLYLVLLRRARALSALERAVLDDPGLADSPLTVRDGHILTLTPFATSSAAGDSTPVTVRVVHVSASSSRNPHPATLPAFVLVHGLGGQLAQFDALVDFFAYYADVLALDFPGCGGAQTTSHLPGEYYTTPSLAAVVAAAARATLGANREVVLVGHSLGTAIAHAVAIGRLLPVRALVAICPPPPMSRGMQFMQRVAGSLPAGIFDLFRYEDRKGGLYSPSVSRMLGPPPNIPNTFSLSLPDAAHDEKLRRRQLRWNLQVDTDVWLKMAAGARVPKYEDWEDLSIPVCFVGASEDKVTPPDVPLTAAACMREFRAAQDPASSSAEEVQATIIPRTGHMCLVATHEVVCGIINDFVISHVDQRLSLSWQLADLAARGDDKWSLKNEAKWRSVQGVSAAVDGSRFRAMKTLRQDDSVQNPYALEENYPDITDVIDISRDIPPYDPKTFARITYHKFPTVSKIPPTRAQVDDFILLVDSILYPSGATTTSKIVAVHCHYGFNRTGFLICAYMIQRMHKPVRVAIEDFKLARPPGIKHPHFVDELYVRYTLQG